MELTPEQNRAKLGWLLNQRSLLPKKNKPLSKPALEAVIAFYHALDQSTMPHVVIGIMSGRHDMLFDYPTE